MLGPRLQRELRASAPEAAATRRRLIVVGWLTFALTLAVPILGVIALSLPRLSHPLGFARSGDS